MRHQRVLELDRRDHSPPDLITSWSGPHLDEALRMEQTTSPVLNHPSSVQRSDAGQPGVAAGNRPRSRASPIDSPSHGDVRQRLGGEARRAAAGSPSRVAELRVPSASCSSPMSCAVDATGEVSVIPQPWTTLMPCRCLKPAIIARGAAEPPTSIPFMCERSHRSGSASIIARIPSQIVGTPAVQVTRSDTNASSRLSGSRCGPG